MSDWKGVGFLIKFLEILFFVTLGVLLVETVSYVGFFQNNLGVSSGFVFGLFLVLYASVVWLFIEREEIMHSDFFVKLGKLFYNLIPLLLVVYLSLVVLEGFNYTNYVLSEFGISLDGFFNLYVFSLFWVVYFLTIVKKDLMSLKRVVLLLPIFFVGVVCLQTWGWYDFWHRTGEDRLIENFQFGFYLFASFLALRIGTGFRSRDKIISFVYVLIACFLFVIAMEEISWGQRILQIETPEIIRQRNIQGETNLHNLSVFQFFLHDIYAGVSFLGASLWLVVPYRFRGREWYKSFVPPSFLFLLFFLAFFYYLYITHINLAVIDSFGFVLFSTNHWQEIAELFLATAVLIFMARELYLRKQDEKLE